MIHWKQIKLEAGESILNTSEKGNSMVPRIYSGQKHDLAPIKLEDVKVDDILFVKVKGNYYTHLVTAIGIKGVQISNNKGHINGWTKQIFGIVTKIH